MNQAYLQLGSNIGDRKNNLSKAVSLIQEKAGNVICKSDIYESEAWGLKDQPDFYNSVVLIQAFLQPEKLLEEIKKIELLMKSFHSEKWGPRIIDIDILFYNNEIIDLPELKIPHPLIQHRKFVLLPLSEIAATFIHPSLNKPVKELLGECEDMRIEKLDFSF